MGPWAAYEAYRNKGFWDFKQQASRYQAFGNWFFGFGTAQMSWTNKEMVQRLAGWAQRKAGTSRPEWNLDGRTHGDDPYDFKIHDQSWDLGKKVKEGGRTSEPKADSSSPKNSTKEKPERPKPSREPGKEGPKVHLL
jgi:hypothetical protein